MNGWWSSARLMIVSLVGLPVLPAAAHGNAELLR
jgi:hypothetical protein